MIPYLKNTFRTQSERSSRSDVRNVRTPRYVLSYLAQPRTKTKSATGAIVSENGESK